MPRRLILSTMERDTLLALPENQDDLKHWRAYGRSGAFCRHWE